MSLSELEATARRLRRDIVTMIFKANSGHPGGSLSATDIITALYFHVMRYDPRNPRWEGRDRFILSKGHAAPAMYAALAEAGFFPKEDLATLRQIGSHLQGHVHITTPGVEMCAGSLG
ncbi:MAG: transketolase, partial [Chloroflexi bacterium]|nr:transketolase [Chloroflexota bacterium]